jgi:hypothetical protein
MGACAHRSVDTAARAPHPSNYRVVEAPRNSPGAGLHDLTTFPPSSQPWELRYTFVVPPLPGAKTWRPAESELYLWGDVDFDLYGVRYGAKGSPISSYKYNQIVPQLMAGNVFAGNNSDYSPVLRTYDYWVIEAQYYWQKDDGSDFDSAGEPIRVYPGEIVTTSISYDPAGGGIVAAISTPRVKSALSLPRPFPNETPALFKSWRDFFEQAEKKSRAPVTGQAVINVETHNVDRDSVCSLLPFEIRSISGAHFPDSSSGFYTRTEDGLSCPTPFVKIGF